MGMFSWITSDTNESIPVAYMPHNRETFEVWMLSPDGKHYREDAYEGYGIFGGKDAYQFLAELNSPEECNGNVEHDRQIGISMFFSGEYLSLPYQLKFVRTPMPYNAAMPSRDCPDQGFLYSGYEEDEWDEEEDGEW